MQLPHRSTMQWLAFGVGIALFLFLFFFNPFSLDGNASKVVAVAVLMVTWWITEALPMPAVALIPLVLFPLLGIAKIGETAAPYANEVVFLQLGGFMIGLGMEKWNLHKRIALSIINLTGTSGNRIVLGFLFATGFISMWISNTATTMMMYPIALSVISVINVGREEHKGIGNFSLCIMLAIAYASNFGGISTIIGTPPNAAYVAFVYRHYNYEISFLNWLLIGTPLAILLILALYLVMVKWLHPNHLASSDELKNILRKELQDLGPMSGAEKRVLFIFLLTATLWITKDLLNQLKWFRLDDNMIAVFGALLMFIVPAEKAGDGHRKILEWGDTKKLAWGILLLFGGGISLAAAMEKAGLIEKLGTWMAGFSGTNHLVLILVIAAVSIFFSEMVSNIAQVIVLAPVVSGIADALQINPFLLGIPMTFAASCASMMPMGTPPNAIVFASGHVKIHQMMRVGVVMNIISVILISLFCYFIIPRLIHMN